jgi:hypothetical protein
VCAAGLSRHTANNWLSHFVMKYVMPWAPFATTLQVRAHIHNWKSAATHPLFPCCFAPCWCTVLACRQAAAVWCRCAQATKWATTPCTFYAALLYVAALYCRCRKAAVVRFWCAQAMKRATVQSPFTTTAIDHTRTKKSPPFWSQVLLF